MIIMLGIESSCDDTAVALLREDGTVLAHQRVSQLQEHARFGGVVPEIAARAHLKAMPYLIKAALEEAHLRAEDISAVAATTGPGLIGGVMVGAMVGKAIALSHQLPFLSINHLEAHALVVRAVEKVAFPYMLLLVSGGHCQILWVKDIGEYTLLGRTRDDALGEAFDKSAKMLGLPYPGGPEIEKYAKKGDATSVHFPRPMLGSPHADFSFSGLKTAVRLHIEAITKEKPLDEMMIANVAASFQQAAIDVVKDRLHKALQLLPDAAMAERLVVAGGVAANMAMRDGLKEVCDKHALSLHVAPVSLCTDNGVMIAWAGIERFKLGMIAELDEDVRARWPLGA